MRERQSVFPGAVHVCSTHSISGIAAYARDFHRLVLAPVGYTLMAPEEVLVRSAFEADTVFHFQLGVFQHRERLSLSHLLRHGYRALDVTLHDPPFLTFPYFQFRSGALMRLSRGFDWYLRSFGTQRRVLERLRHVFVLSEAGRASVLRLAPRTSVTVIPHLVDPEQIWRSPAPLPSDMLYFGFIGPNKGLEYVLRLHRAVRAIRPETRLHVLGKAAGGSGEQYLARLRAEHVEMVTFHGFVPEECLDELFASAAHVVLPYAPYRHIVPASGSALHAMRRGRLVWTSNVNAMAELISDGETGFMLSMNVDLDARRMAAVMANPDHARAVSDGALKAVASLAHFPFGRLFKDPV